MPMTKCPHCRRIHFLRREILGLEIGCMNPSCEQPFKAIEYYRHRGVLSQTVFYSFIAYAIYMVITWVAPRYYQFATQMLASIN